MEFLGSLPHSQNPATRPYPQPARFSPSAPHIPLPGDPILTFWRRKYFLILAHLYIKCE